MKKRLIFFCPSKKRAVGGIKIIYKLAQLADEFAGDAASAYVFHPNHPWLRLDWFSHRAKIMKAILGLRWDGKPSLTDIRNHIDPDTDFVFLPELWVRKYGAQLLQLRIPFAIFVQGGYLIGNGDHRLLQECYETAKFIITNSDKSSELVEFAYPSTRGKIIQLRLHIDTEKFQPKADKENIISYMPRRLPQHAEFLKFLLEGKLPPGWRLLAIDSLSEADTALAMARSKIFISFSDREGFGLPPIEAALSGNFVVGYTGEAGKEYWQQPLFTEVPQGDLLGMAEKLLYCANNYGKLNHGAALTLREELSNIYSENAMKDGVRHIVSRVISGEGQT